MRKLSIFITIIMTMILIIPKEVMAAESTSASSNTMEIIIGFIALCVITAIVTVKRVLYAKKNN